MGFKLYRKHVMEDEMPIFEYECKKCGKVEEILTVKMSDYSKPDCIDCKVPMRRIVSKSNFHLKGTGWFRDGY